MQVSDSFSNWIVASNYGLDRVTKILRIANIRRRALHYISMKIPPLKKTCNQKKENATGNSKVACLIINRIS